MREDEGAMLAIARVKARLDEALDTNGLPGDHAGFQVDVVETGSLKGVRPRSIATGETQSTWAMSHSPRGEIHPDHEARLDREIARHVRRLLRLQSIGDAEPLWSYTMHRLMLAMFRHADVDPVLTVAGRHEHRRMLLDHVTQDTPLSVGAIKVEDGRIDAATLNLPGLQFAGNGRTAVLITADIPQTVVASLPGRRLRDVVDHPAVARAGPIRIEAADVQNGHLTLVVEDVQDHVRRPPTGADRRWRKAPYHPWWGE
jgi:hypothetical protein